MKNQKIFLAFILLTLAMLAGCNFVGAVFKTGIGVGAFVVIVIVVIILMLSRRRRV